MSHGVSSARGADRCPPHSREQPAHVRLSGQTAVPGTPGASRKNPPKTTSAQQLGKLVLLPAGTVISARSPLAAVAFLP